MLTAVDNLTVVMFTAVDNLTVVMLTAVDNLTVVMFTAIDNLTVVMFTAVDNRTEPNRTGLLCRSLHLQKLAPAIRLHSTSSTNSNIISECHSDRVPGGLWLGRFSCELLVSYSSPSACLPACLSVCLSVCMSVCMSVCLPVCLPVCQQAALSPLGSGGGGASLQLRADAMAEEQVQ